MAAFRIPSIVLESSYQNFCILRSVRGQPTLGVPSPEALPFLVVWDGKVAARDPLEVACD